MAHSPFADPFNRALKRRKGQTGAFFVEDFPKFDPRQGNQLGAMGKVWARKARSSPLPPNQQFPPPGAALEQTAALLFWELAV